MSRGVYDLCQSSPYSYLGIVKDRIKFIQSSVEFFTKFLKNEFKMNSNLITIRLRWDSASRSPLSSKKLCLFFNLSTISPTKNSLHLWRMFWLVALWWLSCFALSSFSSLGSFNIDLFVFRYRWFSYSIHFLVKMRVILSMSSSEHQCTWRISF